MSSLISHTERRNRTQGNSRVKTRVRGRISEYGFQILTVDKNELLAEAGNNPTDPAPTANLRPGHGAASLELIREWCESKGQQIVANIGGRWFGIETKPLL